MSTVAAILAAGEASRFGSPKQLALYRGVALVTHAVRAAAVPGVDATCVVLGAHAERVERVLDTLAEPVERMINAAWSEGIASSLRAAVAWAASRDASSLVVLLCDQPLVTGSHVSELVRTWSRGASAVASEYAGTWGAPAVFDAKLFPMLRALRGDAGAGKALREWGDVARVPFPGGAADVDTPLDVVALQP